MKITYAQNPLRTTVELNEQESRELWLKIKIERLESLIDLSRSELKRHAIAGLYEAMDYQDIDDEVNSIHANLIESLCGSHCGDCVCYPGSCSKCMAEEHLGINTIEGLTKYPGGWVDAAFSKAVASDRTLDEAIEFLETYTIDYHDQKTVERWKCEIADAIAWLKQYREKHFRVSVTLNGQVYCYAR